MMHSSDLVNRSKKKKTNYNIARYTNKLGLNIAPQGVGRPIAEKVKLKCGNKYSTVLWKCFYFRLPENKKAEIVMF